MSLDPKLLEVLACPDCKSQVVEKEDRILCLNADCRRCYTVSDGIPVMLIDESEIMDADTWRKLTA